MMPRVAETMTELRMLLRPYVRTGLVTMLATAARVVLNANAMHMYHTSAWPCITCSLL